jgi:hypothetical protein
MRPTGHSTGLPSASGDFKRCLRADPRGANKSLKSVGISHAQEAALPACSCRRLAPPFGVAVKEIS